MRRCQKCQVVFNITAICDNCGRILCDGCRQSGCCGNVPAAIRVLIVCGEPVHRDAPDDDDDPDDTPIVPVDADCDEIGKLWIDYGGET